MLSRTGIQSRLPHRSWVFCAMEVELWRRASVADYNNFIAKLKLILKSIRNEMEYLKHEWDGILSGSEEVKISEFAAFPIFHFANFQF
jgi:hypothetical protein